ncbi:hypothetical protein GOEFS_044_00130 [Gordonia effusa NBRC 100432]|uniref:Cell surface protein n=1 Tax=Gordonia effusa NBRC 100432 TaxID=1077974 RepID=H0QYS6_9ACTN|nr:hypothetical protein GOEFS_044_00130 [Gordonia effusa NBRC 100432]
MKSIPTRPRRRLARLTAVLGIIAAPALFAATPAAAAPSALQGSFALQSGVCSGGSVTGSFFRMILPAGNTSGPFLSNSDSTCSDKTVTPLAPGTAGGLTSGNYQPQPSNAFDGSGNAISGSVTRPVKFYGVGFATATNPTDPQTSRGTSRPQIYANGTALSGDLSSFGVTWNRQVFNQGAPKPGGGLPGKTTPVRGTIDPSSGAFVLEWTSQIVGGPFNNFTGLWHLTGTFRGTGLNSAAAPANPAATSGPTPAPGQTAAPGAAPQATPGAQPVANPNATVTQVAGNPQTTVQSLDVPAASGQPRWLLPVLVVITALAAALLTNADRLFSRRRGSD